MTGVNGYSVHRYTGAAETSVEIHRSVHGPTEGHLLLSIEGEQNPDEACHTATNFQAQIVLLPTGRVSLYWTDQLVNDWSEEYATLSAAMLRLAGIIRCYEHDFDLGFSSGDVARFEREQAPKAYAEILR